MLPAEKRETFSKPCLTNSTAESSAPGPRPCSLSRADESQARVFLRGIFILIRPDVRGYCSHISRSEANVMRSSSASEAEKSVSTATMKDFIENEISFPENTTYHASLPFTLAG